MIPGMRQHIAPTVLYSMVMVVIVPGAAATSYPEDEVIMVAPERMALVEEEAWNAFNWASFDQDKIVSFGNYQYSVYWAADRTLSLMRWNLANDVVQIVRFESYRLADGLPEAQQRNGHRNTVIGISPGDGRIHTVFRPPVSRRFCVGQQVRKRGLLLRSQGIPVQNGQKIVGHHA